MPQAPKPGKLEEEEAGGDPGQVEHGVQHLFNATKTLKLMKNLRIYFCFFYVSEHGVQHLFKATKNFKINEKSTYLFCCYLCMLTRLEKKDVLLLGPTIGVRGENRIIIGEIATF